MSTGGGPGDSSFDYVAHDQKTATNLGKKSKDMPTKTNYDKAIKNEHDKAVQSAFPPPLSILQGGSFQWQCVRGGI